MLVCVDASALLKLITRDRESDALSRYLAGDVTVITNRVALVEAERGARRADADSSVYGGLESGLTLRELDSSLSELAGKINPSTIGSVEALCLATAVELRSELDAFITYDPLVAEVARSLRLPVVSPT